jgi:hypothetical protein
MPHVIVKLWPGKSEAHKRRLAERIADRRRFRQALQEAGIHDVTQGYHAIKTVLTP